MTNRLVPTGTYVDLDIGRNIDPNYVAELVEEMVTACPPPSKPQPSTLYTNPDTAGSSRLTMSSALALVAAELGRAKALYPRPFVNAHEAHSVIQEEYDEHQKEVYINCKDRNAARYRNELIQLAAMAIRALIEVDPHAP